MQNGQKQRTERVPVIGAGRRSWPTTVCDVADPGPLLASGRDADIFEYGPGLVLRRSRRGRSMAGEARTMEYLRGHGYPVPAVEEISDDGTDLVMERIDGPSMVDYMSQTAVDDPASGDGAGDPAPAAARHRRPLTSSPPRRSGPGTAFSTWTSIPSTS